MGTKYVVMAERLNKRNSASYSGAIIGECKADDEITITDEKDGWGKTDDGGFVKLEFCRKVEADPQEKKTDK